ETSRIVVEGAVIRVTTAGSDEEVSAVTQYLGFVINPDSSEDPGLAAVGIPVLPTNTGDGTYTVYVSVFGETLGGIDVESSEFAFTVNVKAGGATSCASIDNLPSELLRPCGPAFLAKDGFLGSCVSNSSSVCGGC